MLATLDVLSGGRLVVGIGAGWLKTEFDAVVTTAVRGTWRGDREYIDTFRVLWSEAAPRFAGRYTKFDGIVLEPKPIQKPLPIWVGGEAGPSLRRTARVGDAWYPIGSNNKHLLDTLPRLKAGIGRLRKAVAEAGRKPDSVGVSFRVKRYGAAVPPGHRRRARLSRAAKPTSSPTSARDGGCVTAIDVDFGGRPDAAATRPR